MIRSRLAETIQLMLAYWRTGKRLGPEPAFPIENAVLRHGREYIGIARPKGLRQQRARGLCFLNATDAALQGCAQYVEGFVMSRRVGIPVHHAWLSADGVHAIDQTLPDAPERAYFGIPFSNAVLERVIDVRRSYGILSLLAERPEMAAEFLGLDLTSG
jgi:hypothetical protein